MIYKSVSEAKEYLTRPLLNGLGLEGILRTGTEVLRNPLLVTDISNRLLCFNWENEDVDDYGLKELLRQGYNSYEFLTKNNISQVWNEIKNNDAPFYFHRDFAAGLRRVFKRITIKNKMIGCLVIFESNRMMSGEDFDLIDYLTQIIAVELQKEEMYSVLGKGHELILSELLKNNIHDQTEMKNRLKSVLWSPFYNLHVLTIAPHIGKEMNNTIFLNNRDYLERIYPTIRSLYLDNRIILLIDLKHTQDLPVLQEKISIILKDQNLQGGLSGYFSNLLDFKTYYEQSKQLLLIGQTIKSDATIYSFSDYYFQYLISSLRHDRREYCLPELYRVLEYDAKMNTEYYNSIYHYLLCGMNIVATAKKLYIHRNTMAYRLQKFSDITGLNLNEGEDCYKLYISYKILNV